MSAASGAAASSARAGSASSGDPASREPSGAEHGGVHDVGGEGAQVLERLRRGVSAVRHGAVAMIPAVPLSRIAWLTTVAICLITCVLLLLSGYLGYAGVLLAVALSAAINLR